MGTHIDMPYHFYGDGPTLEDFPASFWIFENPLFIDIFPKNLVVKDELINSIERRDSVIDTDILIVRTGIGEIRGEEKFWKENYGFDPELADYLREKMPKLRVFGFDSISVSSFANRMIGREAHKRFLDPEKPVLLLEDMNLDDVCPGTKFEKLIVAPMPIASCDGLPCMVIGEI